MSQPYPLRIDAYSHIIPPRYREFLAKVNPEECERKVNRTVPLWNMEERFKVMDHFGEVVQVITLGWPPVEDVVDPVQEVEICKMVNDDLAELVQKYPSRFVAGIAHVPVDNVPEALKEIDRAIVDLRLRGVQLYTPVHDKPLDLPEFWPIYEKMEQYDLPVFIHPMREQTNYPDYRTEKESKHGVGNTFGWPYETSAAMMRLVFSGIMEKYPNLKVVTHHCGGMVPYFAERLNGNRDLGQQQHKPLLTKPTLSYFKKFYADTALYGNTPGLMCGYAFFGPDKLVFAADMPLGDSQRGYRNYRQTFNAIDAMTISDEDKKKIYEDNARKLMRLPI